MRALSPLIALLALAACDRGPTDSADTSVNLDQVDADGDGVPADLDCDDSDASVFPEAEELCNGIDDNCDELVDNDASDAVTYTEDADGDGVGAVGGATISACEPPEGYAEAADDCDDTRSDVYPDAEESDCADPTDYNCDGSVGYADGDGDGVPACEDCDDADETAAPGLDEVAYDGADNDCDPLTLDDDLDQDGFVGAEDCDDADPEVSPDAVEVAYDGIDNDCDEATLDDDLDQDGFVGAEDCDDTDAAVSPDAAEVAYDGIDNDCDEATVDDDLDGDGVPGSEDCDDTNADVSPSAAEVAYDGVDNDCDPSTLDDDLDGDGVLGADDCDDTNAEVSPSATEVAYDGVDNDCDPSTLDDDLDQDGKNQDEDCDESDPTIFVGADEVWYDGVDQDCDGANDYDQDGDGATTLDSGGIDCNDTDPSAQGCGLTESTAVESCAAAIDIKSDLADGTYWVNPSGADAFEVTCDMTTDGGGWTRIDYAADLEFKRQRSTQDGVYVWLTQDFTTVLSKERVLALQSVATEGRQTYIGLCRHSVNYFYTQGGNHDFAAGFRFLDGTETGHGSADYSPHDITVPDGEDGCAANDSVDRQTLFEVRSPLVPLVNIEIRDGAGAGEFFGSPLTENPAWLR